MLSIDELSRIAKASVKKIGENPDSGLGMCYEISLDIIKALGKKGYDYPVDVYMVSPYFDDFSEHYIVYLPKQDLVIDTQTWQPSGKPTPLDSRRVVFRRKLWQVNTGGRFH